MPRASAPWSEVAALALLQWLGGALAMASVLGLSGSASVGPAILATLAAAAAWPLLRPGPWDRPAVQVLCRRIAVLHGLAAPAAVLALLGLQPAWLAGAHPAGTALAATVLAASAGFGLTLCGLNATVGTWGPLNGTAERAGGSQR